MSDKKICIEPGEIRESSTGKNTTVIIKKQRNVNVLVNYEDSPVCQSPVTISLDAPENTFYVPNLVEKTNQTTCPMGKPFVILLPEFYNKGLIIGNDLPYSQQKPLDLLNLNLGVWQADPNVPLKVFFGALCNIPIKALPEISNSQSGNSCLQNFPTLTTEESENLLFVQELTKEIDIEEGENYVDKITDQACEFFVEQILGTNFIPAAAAGVVARQILKNFGSKFYFKTIRDARCIVFKGYAGLRKYFTATYYKVTNPKVVSLTIGTKGTLQGIKSSARGTTIAFLIVGAIDLVQHLVDDEATFADLVAQLGIDFTKVAISTAAAIGAGALITGVVMLVGITAPVWLVVGGAIAVGIGVGFLLDYVDTKYQITDSVKKEANKAQDFLGEWYEEYIGYPGARLLRQLEQAILYQYMRPYH